MFGFVCLAAAAVYVGAIGRHYLAVRWESLPNPRNLERAARLEPWNADAHWRLGRYSLFIAQDAAGSVSDLEAAVALNPHVARYWLDLAAAFQVAGDVEHQRAALEQALRAEPTAPDVAWEAGNFYLAENELHRALSLFRVVMMYDPEQLNSALAAGWRATRSVNTMLAESVPAEPDAYLAFLNLLTNHGQTAGAEIVWNRLAGLAQRFPAAAAFPYIDYLIQNHEVQPAVRAWQQLVKGNRELQAYRQAGNLLVDGGLENDFLNGGFDWHYSASDAAQLSFDTSEFHSGNQSLRMVFTGPAVSDVGVFQYVAVQPNQDYHFSAYTRSQDIESASGPRIAIVDAYSGRLYVVTDDSLGTTGWRQQSQDFHTAPDTYLLVVKVTRAPGTPLIKGKFWIDDVSLIAR